MKPILIISITLILIFYKLSLLADEKPCYLRTEASKGINQKLLANISFSLISQYLGDLEPWPAGGVSGNICIYDISVIKDFESTFANFQGKNLNSYGDSKLPGTDGLQHSILKALFRSLSNKRSKICEDYGKLLEECGRKEQGIKLGKTATELDSRKKTVCTGEAAIGNLIADAMRDGVNADIGFTNGGGIRSKKIYAPGTTITRRDILTELPFRNVVVKLGLTGAQIWQALENGVSRIEKIAGSYKYSKNPGRFPQVSGMSFIWNPKAKAGSRIVSVKVGGKTLNMSYIYTVATNEYMARGGDGYSIFKKGSVLIGSKSATLLTSMVMDYIIAKGTVSPKVEGRIVAK